MYSALKTGTWTRLSGAADAAVGAADAAVGAAHLLSPPPQHAYSGGSGHSSRLACRPAKLQPVPLERVQHSNVRVFAVPNARVTPLAATALTRTLCRFPVIWTPPPVSSSSNFSTSLCVVTYDDDSFCSNATVGLISPPVCLPLFIPAPQPRWTQASDAQPPAADGTFPPFVGAVGCRSFFVAAAADANYDVAIDFPPKLPPGVSVFSR